MTEENLLKTPLWQWHVDQGGRMVGFGGWSMPVQYTSIIAEHNATRTAVGIFDVSHMGRFWFRGGQPDVILDRLLTRRVAGIEPGKIRYSLMCRPDGGIIDDVLFYHLPQGGPGGPDESQYMMVVNASNREKVRGWLDEHTRATNMRIDDRTTRTAMIAVQGPQACAAVARLADRNPAELAYYTGRWGTVGGRPAVISRTGYTGEDGCELIVDAADAVHVADAVLRETAPAGGLPAGLGARDTLRLEAAMPLYGHELGDAINAAQTGLKFAINLKDREFVGRDGIRKAQQQRDLPVRVGLRLEGKRAARESCLVFASGERVGEVTSGTFSPTLNAAISMAYVDPRFAAEGTALEVDIRGAKTAAVVCALPFYSRS